MATFIPSFESLVSVCKSLLAWSSCSPDVQNEMMSILKDLEWLEKTLASAKAALTDAENRAVGGEKRVKLWLVDVQNLAYRASDLIGVYEYEVIAQEVRNRDYGSQKSSSSTLAQDRGKQKVSSSVMTGTRKFGQVHDYSSSPFINRSFRTEFGGSVSNLREDLEEINKRKEMFRFDKEDAESSTSTGASASGNRLTGSLPIDDVFIGREKEMKEMIDLLLARDMEQSNDGNVPVIALVGMGGVGKTTLAQHVYNHPDVGLYYSARGWVHVSDVFHVETLTKATLEALNNYAPTYLLGFSSLQRCLSDEVRDRRFLLILDDVWNEDVQKWDTFYSSLRKGAKGSKIIVTTRSHEVAQIMRPVRCINLDCLTEEDSWALFQMCAFRDPSKIDFRLADIGRQIAAKCYGLPLAIKVLGRYLIQEPGREQENQLNIKLDIWRHVLGSNLWDESMWEVGQQVLRPLTLSYIPLPPHLKRCFLMSSLYPKDRAISIRHLVELWMAHELVDASQVYNGKRFVDELVSRSFFFHPREKNSVRLNPEVFIIIDGVNRHEYVMIHDIIHDLARYLWRDKILPADEEYEINHEIHHAFVDKHERILQLWCHYPNHNCSLRTLESHCGPKLDIHRVPKLAILHPERDTLDSVRKLTYSTWGKKMDDELLHGHFGKLRNLRHLHLFALHGNRPMELLETVCKLYNLRILYLTAFEIELPESIGNLRHLIHVRIPFASNVPQSIGRLTKLLTLKLPGAMPRYLPDCISELVNLQDLNLTYSAIEELPDGISELVNLQNLKLTGSAIKELPDGISELVNLENLYLESSRIQELPESICNLKALQTLNLHSCPGIRKLPVNLGNLTSLRILHVDDRVRYFPSGVGNLTLLQEFPLFLVPPKASAVKHAGIEELKHLVCIRGNLTIKGLDNVVHEKDAAEATLENKTGIRELELQWAPQCESNLEDEHVLDNLWPPTNMEHFFLTSRKLAIWLGDRLEEDVTSRQDEHVLENLRPHTNIEHFKISGWRGRKLATWLGDRSFGKLEQIYIEDLPYCASLCPLHQLPSLKYLGFSSMPSLACLALESSSRTSLHSNSATSTTEQEPSRMICFPMLEHLSIESGCPKLASLVYRSLPSLKQLEMDDCSSLTSVPRLPVIGKLTIENFSGQFAFLLDYLSSLKALVVTNCKFPTCITLDELPALESLEITGCPNLLLSGSIANFPPALRIIDIRSSPLSKEWCLNHIQSELAHFKLHEMGDDVYLFPAGSEIPSEYKTLLEDSDSLLWRISSFP